MTRTLEQLVCDARFWTVEAQTALIAGETVANIEAKLDEALAALSAAACLARGHGG